MPSLASAGLASMALMAGFSQLGHSATLPVSSLRARQDPTDWKSIQCTSDGVNDASVDEATRWSRIAADAAWSDVVSGWQSQRDNNPDSDFAFSRHVSNVFNGPEFMDCHKMIGDNGCQGGSALQCHDTNHPAGYFILNSFRKLDGILWNLHETLDNAHNDIGGGIGTFSDTFAPQKEKTMDVDIIMDIVLLGYGSLAAPIWKSALKGWKFADNRPNDFDSLTDFTNNLVSNGITLAKDLTTAEESQLGSQNQVSERLRDIVLIWQNSVVKLAEKIFSGSDEDMETLGKVIANGKMVASTTDIPTVEELRHQLERSIYAALIPVAWEISEQDISPFVLDSGMSCDDAGGDWGQNEGKFLSGVKDSGMACHGGRAYYLVGAKGSCHGGSPFEDPDTNDCDPFSALPGVTSMDGKSWGGISREDIVFGSINTFVANGNKNHETRLNFADGVPEDQITGLGDDIQTANTFALPICDLKTAWDNFYGSGSDRSSANFPCKIDHSGDFNNKDIPPPYDCDGSGMCGSAVNFVRNCDNAVNKGLQRFDDYIYGSAESDAEEDGARNSNCKIFIAGPAACKRSGNEMWYDYQDLKNSEMGGCGRCGSKHWGNNNECRTTVNYVA
ncbi:hypothetical protein CC79DRAFT_922150 [Sarocladium strictum]